MERKNKPGTKFLFEDQHESAFQMYGQMIQTAGGLSLGQVCNITGLDSYTIQNWVKRSYVARPTNKKYFEKHLARILLINSLKDAMKIEDVGRLLELVNGDVDDESDDLISEEKLYDLFAYVVYHLDDAREIDIIIKKHLETINMNDDKLFIALETMAHAYVSSKHRRLSQEYLNALETY